MTKFLNPKMLKIGLKKQNIYDIFLRFKVGLDFELLKIFVFKIVSFFYYITIFEPQKALEIPLFEHWARYIFFSANKNLEFAFSRKITRIGHIEWNE